MRFSVAAQGPGAYATHLVDISVIKGERGRASAFGGKLAASKRESLSPSAVPVRVAVAVWAVDCSLAHVWTRFCVPQSRDPVNTSLRGSLMTWLTRKRGIGLASLRATAIDPPTCLVSAPCVVSCATWCD